MLHDDPNFAGRIRELGYRLTPQRQLILDTLIEMNRHASVMSIYDRVHAKWPAIDRATVYRTINLFHQVGFLDSAEIGDTTVYEIAQAHPHHHLVCNNCGKVELLDDDHFDTLTDSLLAEHGFHAELHHLTIAGVCADCG